MKVSGLALLAAVILGGTTPALAQDKVEVQRTVTTKTSNDGPDVRVHRHHRHKVCRTHWYHHRKVTRCTWRRWG